MKLFDCVGLIINYFSNRRVGGGLERYYMGTLILASHSVVDR